MDCGTEEVTRILARFNRFGGYLAPVQFSAEGRGGSRNSLAYFLPRPPCEMGVESGY